MPSRTAARVTTIIPTFRRPAMLRRAMLSVLEQDYAELQLCVYDNASGDETADVVAELARIDSRVSYHCHDRNIGAFANFQCGLARVETEYFSFLSDDDYLLPGFYRAATAGLDASTEAIFWAGLTLRLDNEGGFFDAKMDNWEREGLFVPPNGALNLLHGEAPCWTATLFRRRVIDEIGLLDDQVGGAIDLDYMLRASARHPYVVSKQPVAVFTMNPDSFSETAPFSAFWPGWLKMIDNINGIDTLPASAREQIASALHHDARRMLFRRGARALARADYSFAQLSVQALQQEYRARFRSFFLRAVAAICETVPPIQKVYTTAYQAVEVRMVRRRAALRAKYDGAARDL